MPRLKKEPTLTPAGKAIGQPRKEPPVGTAVRITELAAIGHTVVGIAASFGVSKDTFGHWLKDDPALKEAFDVGREKERQTLHGMLFRKAKSGNIIAAMFLLKSRHGYREGEAVDSGAGPRVVINMPGAMPLGAFVSIENESDGRVQRAPNPAALPTARG